jgi:hypothetical protein
MRDEKHVVDGRERGVEKTDDVASLDPLPRRRSVSRDSEPLLVELAWLVIEGAVFLRRLRGLLARI